MLQASLRKLRLRLVHVMSRMSDPVDSLLRNEALDLSSEIGSPPACHFNAQLHARHIGLANTVYARFVDDSMEECMSKCMHDVHAMTKYVSWDFHSGTKDALYNVLIEPISSRLNRPTRGRRDRREARGRGGEPFGSYEDLVDGLTEILTSRRVSEQMRLLMNELVREVIMAWREEFCRMIRSPPPPRAYVRWYSPVARPTPLPPLERQPQVQLLLSDALLRLAAALHAAGAHPAREGGGGCARRVERREKSCALPRGGVC